MDAAVVKISGKQHLVSPGDRIKVDGYLGQPGEEIDIKEVLLGTKVTAKILATGKGDKIRVAKFKAKSRYRRVMGFRPKLTTLEILNVGESVVARSETTKQSPAVKKPKVKK